MKLSSESFLSLELRVISSLRMPNFYATLGQALILSFNKMVLVSFS